MSISLSFVGLDGVKAKQDLPTVSRGWGNSSFTPSPSSGEAFLALARASLGLSDADKMKTFFQGLCEALLRSFGSTVLLKFLTRTPGLSLGHFCSWIQLSLICIGEQRTSTPPSW